MQAIRTATPDGLALAAQAWGNPQGLEILFVHGFSQSHLSWRRQVSDAAMAREFRMVTFDLRGHGASDKPLQPDFYGQDRLWAGDVAAVMAAAGLRRPVIVGWSYAGRVISDYVKAHGTARIAGINYVDALTKTEPALLGPGRKHIAAMTSEDLATNIAGTRAFLRACFEVQPSPDDFETMLAFNMVVPARVRAAMQKRAPNPGDALAALDCPVLVTHGALDQIILPAMGEFTAAAARRARLSIYQGIGHAPFWEDAPRFNRELADFARQAHGSRRECRERGSYRQG